MIQSQSQLVWTQIRQQRQLSTVIAVGKTIQTVGNAIIKIRSFR